MLWSYCDWLYSLHVNGLRSAGCWITLIVTRYKAQGAAIVDKNGTKDRCEFFTISSDELHGIAPASAVPSTIEGNWSLFQSFTTMAHNTIITILNSLDAPLGLPAGTLSQRHRITEPSGGSARILKYPPQPLDDQRISHAPHTDFGSVTLLFSQVGGLQVRPPGMTSAWGYVVSEPGHAVVNLGDGMVKFTNGLLRSAYHRVISPPGAQAALTRYSLVYFARAEDEVLLKRLESKVIPELCADETEDVVSTKEWILRRIQAMKQASRNKAEWDGIKGTEDLPRQKL